ncbi:integral membrane protein [Apiospora rasikravindrae]|uniref:Integral membrane protein n=1 Tax=Apiospora rasikravindrae TaxID=990691 RepID=A0ABR1THG6_9PEZI
MADERLEPPRQQSSYFSPVTNTPNSNSDPDPDSSPTPTANTNTNLNAAAPNTAAPAPEPRHRFRPLRTLEPRQSNIRIRRAPPSKADAKNKANPQNVRSMLDVDGDRGPQEQQSIHLRRLSGGSPTPVHDRNANQPQQVRSMLDVDDNTGPDGNTQATDFGGAEAGPPPVQAPGRRGLFHRFSRASMRPEAANNPRRQTAPEDEYDSNIVDMLDVVDPEVSTLSSITNVQNSLFVPSLGRWVNRRPTYNLTRVSDMPGTFPSRDGGVAADQTARFTPEPRQQGATQGTDRPLKDVEEEDEPPERPSVERIPSYMTERFYAVRPSDTSLAHWSDEDLEELNDHVRHMLHSKRSAFKRSMKAFGQYVRKPLGFLVTLYAFLITVFGLAWVLFLIGWIYLGDQERRDYIIDVIDNVLVALFAVVGDGMIPWRLVDTYHMCFIARYHHLTWKLRDKMHVPDLKDHNDLPSEPVISRRAEQEDIEAQRQIHTKKGEEHSVLTPHQQAKLEHHQACFSKSHTFYKPHETETHYAFPLRLLVAIVVLLDCHSCFQLALGLTTWIIDYHVRPAAATATILCCSIAVNITAGVLISVGDRRTRKKDVVERMFRQELTQEAIRRIEERKEKEEEERNRLENIEEESPGKPKGASFDLGDRLKQNFIKPKNGDDGHARSSKSLDISRKQRKSNEIARKPVNRVGMFDTSVSNNLTEEGDDVFGDPKPTHSASPPKE